MKWDLKGVCFAAAGTLMGLTPGPAVSAQLPELTRDFCGQATTAQERAANIPQHLLRAISLAESGRWDSRKQAKIAWPWTVTAHGEGRYFPTKDAAVRHVRTLKAAGTRNIDVGCMQVNLYYHGDAFPSLEQALDPVANVAYASQFLKDHFAATRSWVRAAGNYHSATPKLGAAYRKKVVRLWRQVRKQERRRNKTKARRDRTSGPRTDPVSRRLPPRRRLAAIDTIRTQRLNARFKARREEQSIDAADGAAIRRRQLKAWRNSGAGTALMAAARRARLQAERRRKFLELDTEIRKKSRPPLRRLGGPAAAS